MEINFKKLQVGYELKDRNLEISNQPTTTYIPFSCKVKLPKPDQGKRGYSDVYINKVKERVYDTKATQ